ncbi:MAG: hypothetical protein M3N53_03780 [Actinomycetota bacterium]|nr:hypothetical protein [Actinomycetota bacterium]
MALLRRAGSSRDIWAAPPGGAVAAAGRSTLKPAIAFVVAVSLGLGGSIMYASMKTSTAVSAEDALAEFQANSASRSGDTDTSDSPKPQRPRRSQDSPATRGKIQKRARGAAAATGGGNAAAAPAATTSGPAEQPPGADGEAPTRTRPAAAPPRPDEGVYAWEVDGYEQAPGVRRDLPSRSHRVITHEGDTAWTEHHIFSEEKEQWLNLNVQSEGVTVTAVRNRVVMGPVTVDKTVTYNPPAFVARFPAKVGRTWEGSWSGRTSGEYTARTFDHTTLVIDGQEVEVWASEIIMNMRGEVEGQAITRSWYAPEHRLVVKQYQKADLKTGPGAYRSEWTGQVLSLDPQT